MKKPLAKEPLHVDFVVESRPLTLVEEKAIVDFIRSDKEKRKLTKSPEKSEVVAKTKTKK